MKKWLTAALVMTLILSPVFTAFTHAEEVSAALVEEGIPEADVSGAEGLTIEGGAPEPEYEASQEAFEENTPAAIGSGRYGTVPAGTLVYAAPGDELAFIALDADGMLLMLGETDGFEQVAFESDSGVVTGYVVSGEINPTDGAIVSAFMDTVAVTLGCAFYNDDPSLPLDHVPCAWLESIVSNDAEIVEAPAGEVVTVAGEPDVLVVGESRAIDVAALWGFAINGEQPVFESSDPGVVTVDAAGVLTAIQPGSAVIRVSVNGQTAETAVTVPNEPDSIVLNPTAIGLKESGATIDVVMQPEGTAASVTWQSSNEACVTVDAATGEMTGVKKGTATITATTRNGATATCEVEVVKAPTKVEVTLSSEALSLGDTAQVLTAVGSGTACSTFTYESSNPGVASVNADGVVTAVGRGTATISAITYNDKKASTDLVVYDLPASVAFPAAPVSLCVGQTSVLEAAPMAADGSLTVSTMTYAVDATRSDGCLSINSATGEMTALSVGSATVIATTHNGVTGECAVNVVSAPSSVALSASELLLGTKESYTGLKVVYTMPDGSVVTDGDVEWTSSKPKTVSIDEKTNALVGAKSGTSEVSTTVMGKKLVCKVTVYKGPSKFTVDPEELTLSAGGMTAKLGVTLPKKTGAAGFTYDSSNPSVASVNADGIVTSGAEGTAKITVRAYNGKTAMCTVRVLGLPARVTMPARMAVGEGQTTPMTASAVSASGGEAMSNYTFWVDPASPDAGCISIDNVNGTITGVRLGTALVRARSHNGIESDNACEVEVMTAPVALDMPAKASIGLKESKAYLAATMRFSNGETSAATGLTWTSSKPKTISIDAKTGAMQGLKRGNAVITATAYNGLSASCTVTVAKAPAKITLNPTSLTLAAGGMRFALQATLPNNSGSSVTYSSSNPSVATVDAGGVITTGSRGSATITAQTFNGKSASCQLTVTALPAKASFASTKVQVKVNGRVTPQVDVRAADGSAAMADLTYSVVSGANYIKVESGEIVGVKSGTAVVRAQTHNGVVSENTCTVVVGEGGGGSPEPDPDPDELFTLEKTATLGVGETYALTGASGATSWTSSDAGVATVDGSGRVTAVSTGSATITASNDSQSGTCKVTVAKAPDSVSISPQNASLKVGDSNKFTVTLPSKSGGHYTFTSSKPSVAMVSADGTVVAASEGTATITVTTYNGKTATATLTVSGSSAPDPDDVDVPAEMKKYGVASYQSYYTEDMSNALKLEYVIYVGQGQLGMPYVYGGGYDEENPTGFDCSGFVYWCFKHIGIKLGDSAYKQGYDSRFKKISSISDLKRGDVVCFNTVDDSDQSDHTGIYLGKGYFIHASSGSSKMKVLVQSFTGDSISNDYYSRNFSWGRRILE